MTIVEPFSFFDPDMIVVFYKHHVFLLIDVLLCLLLFGARVQMVLLLFSATSNDTRLLALLDVVYRDVQDRLGRFLVTVEFVDDLLKYTCKLGTD